MTPQDYAALLFAAVTVLIVSHRLFVTLHTTIEDNQS
jgi:hypothetical protein